VSKTAIFKFLTYFFIFYPLFGLLTVITIGSPPRNVTGLMMIVLIFFVLLNAKVIVYSRFLQFYALFFVYITILNIVKVNSDSSFFKFLYANTGLHFLLFLIILQWDINYFWLNLKLIHRLLVATIILSAIVIIVQQFIPTFFVNPRFIKAWMEIKGGSLFQAEELRSPSIYSWGGAMGVGLIFLPFIAIVVNNYLINKRTRLAYIFLFLGLLVTILTKGRWMMINAIVLFAMIFHYNKVHFSRVLKIVVILCLALICVYYLLPLIGVNVKNLIAERILETNKGGLREGSASSRIIAFEVFFKLFPKNPVFGVGMQLNSELMKELAGRSSQIHVGYLALFYHYGLIGGIFYMGFIYSLTKTLYRNAKIHGYYSPLYSWIGFLLSNLTLFYIMPFEAGLLLILLLDKYYLSFFRSGNLISPPKISYLYQI
jgi:hypothetical protein